MSFILSPSSTLYFLGDKDKPVQLLQSIEGYTFSGNSLVVFNHKKLTVYNISTINQVAANKGQLPKVNEGDFNKKVEAFSIVDDQNVIVSDKYGDIFLMKQGEEKVFLNENFSIPTLLEYVSVGEGKDVFIVADEYSKVKVFNYNNPHQIYSIWTPFEATVLQIIRVEQTLLYFVRINKKDTVECKYKLFTLDIDSLTSESFPGVEIQEFKSEFSDDHFSKIVVNKNSVYIASLQRDKLLVQRIELGGNPLSEAQISYSIGKQDWSYIDVAYNNQLYVFLGRENLEDHQQGLLETFKSVLNLNVVESGQTQYLISIPI